MNKPVAFFCGCIVAFGLFMLTCSTYLTIAYGRGNPEAGNFNRCVYSKTWDPATGRTVRSWDVIGESTEDDWVDRLNMWAVGFGFVVVGAMACALDWARPGKRHFV